MLNFVTIYHWIKESALCLLIAYSVNALTLTPEPLKIYQMLQIILLSAKSSQGVRQGAEQNNHYRVKNHVILRMSEALKQK